MLAPRPTCLVALPRQGRAGAAVCVRRQERRRRRRCRPPRECAATTAGARSSVASACANRSRLEKGVPHTWFYGANITASRKGLRTVKRSPRRSKNLESRCAETVDAIASKIRPLPCRVHHLPRVPRRRRACGRPRNFAVRAGWSPAGHGICPLGPKENAMLQPHRTTTAQGQNTWGALRRVRLTVDVPPPSPDVVPIPPSPHPVPPPPALPEFPELPPEITEPVLPGKNQPVREPIVPTTSLMLGWRH